MLCPACKVEIPQGQRFCGGCGVKVESADELTISSDATRLAGTPASAQTEMVASTSGWLSSSGSIDHGRFGPGTVLDGRYRIIGLLGKGGMGEVYRADDLRLGQPVALKFLPAALSADSRRLAQLHNEVRTARQVSHPNVCRVYDIGDIEGQLFLSMEYVDGEDLAASLKRVGRFPEDRAIEIARQLCAGLAAAHDRGIIHRDLKPANIMIDAEGRVRIMDFGLAAAGDVENVRVGTPAYMAPEQLEGREVTKKSDIYALGLVLYELFTGRRAFTAKSLAELVEQQASGELTAPTEIVKGLDPAIEKAIERCLDRDPVKRSPSVLSVAAGLPGADPLAAALAAGETPSPQLLAAVGGDAATLTPRAGMLWLAIAVILAILVTSLGDRTSLLARVPLNRAPAVLADKAEEFRKAFGYDDPVMDQAHGFIMDGEYLSWAERHGSGDARWPQLAEGRPAPMAFWYRTSPRLLLPMSPSNSRNLFDPPFTGVTGMTITKLDLQGRLLSFEAMPRQIDPDEQMPASTVDWLDMMMKAGLDPLQFDEIPPGRTPRSFADARHAYRGPLQGTDLTVTVETASYRGRPVYFEVIGPWTSATRDPGAESGNDGDGPLQVITIFSLLVIAVFLTRANLKTGRADRQGAFRLATFMVGLYLAIWIVAPHYSAIAFERQRLFFAVALAMFLAGAMYVIYLAVEPFVRRGWPESLVSWAHLLSGKIRDPFVGRDLVIGIACGMAMTLFDRLDYLVPLAFGWPEPKPDTDVATSALLGLRPFLGAALNQVSVGIQNGLLAVLAIALVRVMTQRVLARRKVRPMTIDVVTITIASTVVMLIGLLENRAPNLAQASVPIITTLASMAIVLFLIYRVGILSAIFAFSANFLMTRIPITFDSSRFYVGPGWALLFVILGLAALGLRWARATEPLLGESAAGREVVRP